MQTIIVETKGDFMLTDLGRGQTVRSDRPYVVLQTPFMDKRVNARQLTNLGEVPAGTSDADVAVLWAQAVEDGKQDEFRKGIVEAANEGDTIKDAVAALKRGDSKQTSKRPTKAQKDAAAALEAANKLVADAKTDEEKAAAKTAVDEATKAVEAAK